MDQCPAQGGDKRILIVDDSVLAGMRLVGLLAPLRTIDIVGTATTGVEAIEMIRTLRPDVVLLDLRLPDCSGLDVLRTVKTEQPEITVFMMSLYARPELRTLCLEAGADHFLDKLTDLNRLPGLIETNNP